MTSHSLPPDLKTRISDARESGKLTESESFVLALLVDLKTGPRAGRAQALSIAKMQGHMQRVDRKVCTERQIKASVKSLIEVHGIPICSSRDRNHGGYFLAVESADLEAAERPLRGEIISLAKRLKAFNPKSDFARHLVGQLAIQQQTS